MIIGKYINSKTVHKVLSKVLSDNSIDITDRVELYRFIDKLSSSGEYEYRVNKDFSAYKLTHCKDGYVKSISDRVSIPLDVEFELRPSKITSWELYWNDELFLSDLDRKTALRIAMDINVAFQIKYAQVN